LPLPALTNFDYRSDQPGITNELIVITNASKPVGLQPGDWFMAVYNNTTNPVAYNITASEVLDTNFNLVRLTNNIPKDFTIGEGAALTNFFLFKVFQPHAGVQFDLTNLTGNADFLIGFNRLPNYTNNFSSNSASPAQPVSVVIHTNDTL